MPDPKTKATNAHGKKQFLKTIKSAKSIITIMLLVNLSVFIFIVLFGGISKVIGILLSINLYMYSLAFVFVFASYLLRFCKWHYYLKKLKITLPIRKSLPIYLSLYSMTITPGQVGRVIGAYTLNRVTKKGFMKVAPIITMDLFSDFIGFSILILVTSVIFNKFIIYAFVFVGLLSITFLFLLHPKLYKVLERVKYLKGVMKRFSPEISSYYNSQRLFHEPKIYLFSLLATTPADILNSMGLYFSLLAIGVKAKIGESIFIFASSQIFGMVSTIPGGTGVSDATIVGMLASFYGINLAQSSAVAILTRIATLWFSVIIGIIFLIYTMRYWNENKRNKNNKVSAG
jgi:uncharacterized protein (TIRG00374 family)